MSSEHSFRQYLSSQSMPIVRRYLAAAFFGGMAMGWYAYSELPGEAVFVAERWGKAVTTGVTFGVFFGLVVLFAAEIPERLQGFWPWGARLLLSVILGFTYSALLWIGYAMLILYIPVDLVQLDGAVVGGIFTALSFSPGVVYRITGWLAALWSVLMIYLALFITWSNHMSLIYTRPATPAVSASIFGPPVAAQPAEHINQYAIVIALLIGFGAYAPKIFAEIHRFWRHFRSAP